MQRGDNRTTGILFWLTKWYSVPTVNPVISATSLIVKSRSAAGSRKLAGLAFCSATTGIAVLDAIVLSVFINF
jgi:hypothetical protein